MKPNPALLAFIILILLTACSPAAASQPSAPPTDAAPSATWTPAATPTSRPAPTATAQLIPEFMRDYIEQGYEARNTDETLCFVIHKKAVHYSPLEGIVFKGRVIRSWLEVSYLQNGEYRQGIILEYVRSDTPLFSKFVWSGSGSGMTNPSVAWVQTIHKGFEDATEGDYPIACGTLGLPANPEIALIPGVDTLYEGIFPVEDGKVQTAWIPGIGRVLPVTQCFAEKLSE